jgi:hypothetical protein
MIQGLIKDMVSRKPNGQEEVSEEVEMESNESENETGDGIPDQVKLDWNDFLGYLDKKGVRGKPELDKGDLGNKYFQQYLKENPNTSLSEAIIPQIRKAYMNLRNENLENIKTGKISYQGAPETFMNNIVLNEKSANPNYVGQHLTQTVFPGYKIKDDKTGETLRAEQLYKSAKSVLKGKPQMQ